MIYIYIYIYMYIYIYIYVYMYICIYIYRKSASRFSCGTVLNTLKQSRINIMRGKKGRKIGLSGNVVASLFLSHNIYIYIYMSLA